MTILFNGQELPELFIQSDHQVKEALRDFENNIYYDSGLKNISGGFHKVDIEREDDDFFYITVKSGIQNDCQNSVNTDHYIMDRLTLLIS